MIAVGMVLDFCGAAAVSAGAFYSWQLRKIFIQWHEVLTERETALQDAARKAPDDTL